MDMEMWIEGEIAIGTDHYTIAREVFDSMVDDIDHGGYMLAAMAMTAGVLIHEFDMDEDEVHEAREDAVFEGMVGS